MNDNTMTAPCPQCGRKLRFGREALGRKAKCLSCTQKLAVLGDGRVYAITQPRPRAPAATVCGSGSSVRWSGSIAARIVDLPRLSRAVLACTVMLILVVLLRPLKVQPEGSVGDIQANVPSALRAAPGDPATEARTEVSRVMRVKSTVMAASWELDPQVAEQTETAAAEAVSSERAIGPPRVLRTSDLLKRGLAHCREARYGEGLHCFEQVLAFAPADGRAHYYRGLALSCLGRYAEAVTAYDRSLGLDPRCGAAESNRAEALAALENPPESGL